MTEQEILRHLPEIVNTMNDGLFLVRPDGTIMMVNDALSRITGYSREELQESPCSVLECDICRIARRKGSKHWCALFRSGKENSRNCHLRRKDGTIVHVLKNAALLRDELGNVLGTVETLTDVTEIDRREDTIRQLSRMFDQDGAFHGMIGRSPVMRRTFELIERAAGSDAPVILFGESGTGKELAARAIHDLGPRSDGPYVQINCSALNESLLESELFGHVKGAFTGAHSHRRGRFEEAGGGDIFLDEIGDIPQSIQIKLLRVIETRTFERVGENQPRRLDARIISATNQNLPALVAQGRFRQDFFYRINVIPIELPALRKRIEDIPLLTDHFIKRLNMQRSRPIHGLAPEAMDLLTRHHWPGNVRELRSALEYAFVVCDAETITPEHLPSLMVPETAPRHVSSPETMSTPPSQERNDHENPPEKTELLAALRKCGGNKSETARKLGISRGTVLNRMRKHGIDTKKIITE
jgi:PAS domain S-box-containing protein